MCVKKRLVSSSILNIVHRDQAAEENKRTMYLFTVYIHSFCSICTHLGCSHLLKSLERQILTPFLFTLHIRVDWSQIFIKFDQVYKNNINIYHNKYIWCEGTFNNKSNGVDLLLLMLIFFINLVKVYKAWLLPKLICRLNKNGGSTLELWGLT